MTESEALDLFDSVFLVDEGNRTFRPDFQRVDVEGDLWVHSHITHLPEIPVPLGEVTGDVSIRSRGLLTLKNGPTKVWGNLNVNNNLLTSLAHAPKQVGGDLLVEANNLTTFDAPHCHVNGNLIARSNSLINMDGCPQVGNLLVLTKCTNLVDLKGLTPDIPHVLLTWNPDLPLLRLLQVPGEVVLGGVPHAHWANAFQKIFQDPKYRGTGKTTALQVALLLKEAGFPPSNIRW